MKQKYTWKNSPERTPSYKCQGLCDLLESCSQGIIDGSAATSFYQGIKPQPKQKTQKLSISGYLAKKPRTQQAEGISKPDVKNQPHQKARPHIQIELHQPIKAPKTNLLRVASFRNLLPQPVQMIVARHHLLDPKSPYHKHNHTQTSLATKDQSSTSQISVVKLSTKSSVGIQKTNFRNPDAIIQGPFSQNISILSLTPSASKASFDRLDNSRGFKETQSIYDVSEDEQRDIRYQIPIQPFSNNGTNNANSNTMRTYTFKQTLPLSVSSRQIESIESHTRRLSTEFPLQNQLTPLRMKLFDS